MPSTNSINIAEINGIPKNMNITCILTSSEGDILDEKELITALIEVKIIEPTIMTVIYISTNKDSVSENSSILL